MGNISACNQLLAFIENEVVSIAIKRLVNISPSFKISTAFSECIKMHYRGIKNI